MAVNLRHPTASDPTEDVVLGAQRLLHGRGVPLSSFHLFVFMLLEVWYKNTISAENIDAKVLRASGGQSSFDRDAGT